MLLHCADCLALFEVIGCGDSGGHIRHLYVHRCSQICLRVSTSEMLMLRFDRLCVSAESNAVSGWKRLSVYVSIVRVSVIGVADVTVATVAAAVQVGSSL